MVINKSLDEVELIAALLHDVQTSHGVVFNNKARKLTLNKVSQRVSSEGISFLTKTMPRLGKAFDKALLEDTKFDCIAVGFKPYRNTKLPRFLGELFSLVFSPDGAVLPEPCVHCIKQIRLVLYSFYKYKLPNSHEQEQQVVESFEKTEDDLSVVKLQLGEIQVGLDKSVTTRRRSSSAMSAVDIAREAKILLSNVFAYFDPTDIVPRHGPGSVATKQQLWDKFRWTNISKTITDQYPIDAYFYASLGHVCDELNGLGSIKDECLPARVLLVPKDSRGPRLISCEPVDFQWIQQGLGRAITELVESHPLTKENVRFTDQQPNRFGALEGSKQGRYATLDLKEASDRISVDLVRLLYPENIFRYLMACRSSCTQLPDGRIIELNKFAPMGSALCFPVLALTIWSILAAGVEDADTRESIYVYGDDVIVPTAYAANAIERLESFGLKVNRDKSCTSGFFRESCGLDAYKGTEVTPVRFRTVWSSTPCPNVYTSWIAYANQLFDRRCFHAYDYIVECLYRVYGEIPGDDICKDKCPSLREVPLDRRPKRRRNNRSLQRLEYFVYDVKSPSIVKDLKGWLMLLRYFTEGTKFASSGTVQEQDSSRRLSDYSLFSSPDFDGTEGQFPSIEDAEPFSVRLYTRRRTSMLVRRWR